MYAHVRNGNEYEQLIWDLTQSEQGIKTREGESRGSLEFHKNNNWCVCVTDAVSM